MKSSSTAAEPLDPGDRVGLLLVNLGTPRSPDPADVRPYLREFLMDPRVLDVATPLRWFIVNLLILPRRPRESGAAYAKIWTEAGSPLLVHSRALEQKVRSRLGDEVVVELAMRYGQPSIAGALERLRSRGVGRIVVFPLYPQYSSAATGSSLERVFEVARTLWNVPYLQVVPPFYDHAGFLDACAEAARPAIERVRPERVFFSFHGLPERHIRKSDTSGEHCLESAGCCAAVGTRNRNCYRAQCFSTARLLAERLGIEEGRRRVCFQSRLGRDPWIRPYTDVVLAEEAQRGVKRAAILSPAFVADCLETVEELGIRGVETFTENGGEVLELAPCINSSDAWVDAVIDIVRRSSRWLEPAGAGVAGDGSRSAADLAAIGGKAG